MALSQRLCAITTALVCLVAGGFAYPTVSVSPPAPAAGDSVVVRCILGSLADDCVLRYTNNFAVLALNYLCYPPEYVLRVDCLGTPPPRGTPCTDTITEYGPVVRAGELPCGLYRVLCESGDSLGAFAVAPGNAGFAVGGVASPHWPLDAFAELTVTVSKLQISGADTAVVPVDSLVCAGPFWFAGLDSGLYRLVFGHSGYVPHVETVTIPSLDADPVWGTRLDVSLMGADVQSSIDGRVVSWMYEPLQGCTVSVDMWTPDSSWVQEAVLQTVCDTAGLFGFDSVPAAVGEEWLCFAVRTAMREYESDTAGGCFGVPVLPVSHQFRLMPTDSIPPGECVVRVQDSIEYRGCIETVYWEDGCDGGSGTAPRVSYAAAIILTNLGSSPWAVSADSVRPFLLHSLTDDSIMPYRMLEVSGLGNVGVLYSRAHYFPDTLQPADSLRVGFPIAVVDTLVVCQRYTLADTMWFTFGLPQLGTVAVFEGMWQVVSGERLLVGPEEHAETYAQRISVRSTGNGCVEVVLSHRQRVAIELFALDGRHIAGALPTQDLVAGRHLVRLPPTRTRIVILKVTADAESNCLLLHLPGR